MEYDNGLETLFLMNGFEHYLENGYWWRIEAREVDKIKKQTARYPLLFNPP
jgi:hypothetical protein